jgi:integrase
VAIAVSRNRLRFGDKVVEGTVKSKASDRKLPLPDNLAATLKAAKSLQAADKLSLGAAYQSSGYVLVDEAGQPLSPHALTSRWSRMLAAAGVRPVRLHDARHTCGTLMHLEGVPIAVTAAWLGHASSAFTMATYVHSQDPALADAARSLARVVTNS